MGNVNQALRERYTTSLDDVVEDLPIERKLEVYRNLQQQASLLRDLEDQLARSLEVMASEEGTFREHEEFLERRRVAYMKRIDPSAMVHEEEDDDDDDDDEEEEARQDGQVGQKDTATIKEIPSSKDNDDPEEGVLGSIEVMDGATAEKQQQMKLFLEQELPEIQRNVAIRARTLWWKRKQYEDKLGEVQNKLKEMNLLIESLEPGLPSLAPMTASPAV